MRAVLRVMFPVALFCVFAAALGSAQSSGEILARVANSALKRHAISYSVRREYKLRNIRYSKEARVIVQETYRPDEGKQFTVLQHSGSSKLLEIVEKLLAFEAEASHPEKRSDHGINSANYEARLRGTQTTAGRVCYVIGLTAKHKSKYLINGTLWVDPNSYGMVRLEGRATASASMWIGAPQVAEEFIEVAGFWLPSRTSSVSSSVLLGTSELEIRYTGYRVTDVDNVAMRALGFHPAIGTR